MRTFIALAVALYAFTGCRQQSPTAPPPPPSAPPTASAPDAIVPVASAPLQQAMGLKTERRLAEARDLLLPLATTNLWFAVEGAAETRRALDMLGEINMEIVFSPAPAPEKVDYTIVAGDSLDKISRKFKTTIELIKKANLLTRDTIRTGDRLRIYQGEFAVRVSKSANVLVVTDRGRFLKRYVVGTGQYGKTPVGDFKITSRVPNPPWWRSDGQTIPFGDPANILGTHWLGFNVSGYGIHGTWETNSIGRQATAGCVRLVNRDVEELYTLLPLNTPVNIFE